MDVLRELDTLIRPLRGNEFASVPAIKLKAWRDEIKRLRRFEPTRLPETHLTFIQEKIYDAVKAAMPYGINRDHLISAVYAHKANGGPDSDRVTIRAHIFKMNKQKLRPLGFEITALGSDAMRYRFRNLP